MGCGVSSESAGAGVSGAGYSSGGAGGGTSSFMPSQIPQIIVTPPSVNPPPTTAMRLQQTEEQQQMQQEQQAQAPEQLYKTEASLAGDATDAGAAMHSAAVRASSRSSSDAGAAAHERDGVTSAGGGTSAGAAHRHSALSSRSHSSLTVLTAVQSANRANAMAHASEGAPLRHIISVHGGLSHSDEPESPSVKPRHLQQRGGGGDDDDDAVIGVRGGPLLRVEADTGEDDLEYANNEGVRMPGVDDVASPRADDAPVAGSSDAIAAGGETKQDAPR